MLIGLSGRSYSRETSLLCGSCPALLRAQYNHGWMGAPCLALPAAFRLRAVRQLTAINHNPCIKAARTLAISFI